MVLAALEKLKASMVCVVSICAASLSVVATPTYSQIPDPADEYAAVYIGHIWVPH